MKSFRECAYDPGCERAAEDTGSGDRSSKSDSEEDLTFTDTDAILSTPTQDVVVLPQHMRCAVHTLNLIATTDVRGFLKTDKSTCRKLYRSAMEKCYKLWSLFNHSTVAADCVEQAVNLSLKPPVDTRWNSTFDAVERILNPRIRSRLPYAMDRLKMPKFTVLKIEFVEEFKRVCSPLVAALDLSQGEKYCYLVNLMPAVLQVYKSTAVLKSSLKYCKSIASAIIEGQKKKKKRSAA